MYASLKQLPGTKKRSLRGQLYRDLVLCVLAPCLHFFIICYVCILITREVNKK